jgi:hypothetical protein
VAYRDGVPVADCLLEAASWQYTVKIACSCGHAAYFHPHALWWLHETKGWTGSFQQMRRRYFCSHCYLRTRRRVRPTITATGREHPTIKLPLPPEDEWNRARRRFR